MAVRVISGVLVPGKRADKYEITGGTGRLSGITGSGTYSGTASGGAGELSFVGTLTR